jgi:Ca2+:H+ antiporter
MDWLRLIVSWATVVAFLAFGSVWLADLGPAVKSTALFLWLFGVIVWSAFGVVHEAEKLADMLGDVLGTLILTLSIVIIEVALISAVMLSAEAPTLGRDTMFAVLMIVLNGVVGLGLIIGGLRHGEQSYNMQGAASYLAVLIPLTVIPLILPNFTISTPNGSLTTIQAVCFSVFTIVLYGLFLALQTGRHRDFFVYPNHAAASDLPVIESKQPQTTPAARGVARHTLLLLLNILPIVLLAKSLAQFLDRGIAALGAPAALGGLLIAGVVFTPEAITALRAVTNNELQRAINLCLGAATSTVGLTVPAVLAISLFADRTVILGLSPSEMTLLAVTLILSTLTFSGTRTTLLEGAVHLVVFFVYIVLIFSP